MIQYCAFGVLVSDTPPGRRESVRRVWNKVTKSATVHGVGVVSMSLDRACSSPPMGRPHPHSQLTGMGWCMYTVPFWVRVSVAVPIRAVANEGGLVWSYINLAVTSRQTAAAEVPTSALVGGRTAQGTTEQVWAPR
jgi:hypothetical protein